MKKLLVVGGTGFIGYHIIKEAKKRKWNITSISLSKPKKKRFHKNVNYKLVDTAGLRRTEDNIEAEGINLAIDFWDNAKYLK